MKYANIYNSIWGTPGTKALSILLVVALLFSSVPSTLVLAEEGPVEDPPLEEETTDTPPPEPEPPEDVPEEPLEQETPPEEEPVEPEPDPTIIDTGDAGATVEAGNVVNVNETSNEGEVPPEEPNDAPEELPEPDDEVLTATEGDEEPPVEEATTEEGDEEPAGEEGSGEESAPEEVPEGEPEAALLGAPLPDELPEPADDELLEETEGLYVENANDGEVEVDAEANANTGENTIEGAGDQALIVTGDARAAANVINIVNLNIINSEGLLLLFNAFNGLSGNINMWDFNLFGDGSASGEESAVTTNCDDIPEDECAGGDLTVINDNDAKITNEVIVRASTGGNDISGGDGDSVILTGDAYAAANVVNIANTNIVDSQYLLMTINGFGDWGGNVLFPGADKFFELFGMSHQATTPSSLYVENNNTAEVTTEVSAEANTGENEAVENDGAGTIVTGDAEAHAAATDIVNTNLTNTDTFMLLFKIHGEWTGNVSGLSQGISWEETPNGLVLYSDGSVLPGSPSGEMGGALTAVSTNNAQIHNTVSVTALTGENKVSSNGGEAVIATGDAYAAANVVNIANTNVVGRNWFLAIINIFGDWSGNVLFGKPDLWIGAEVNLPSSRLDQGDRVEYNYTVINKGDVMAPNVMITDVFDPELLEFNSSPNGGIYDGFDQVNWWLGDLLPGEMRTVSYKAHIKYGLPYGNTFITNVGTASSDAPDAQPEDNTESVTVTVGRMERDYGNTLVTYTPDPDLVVTKTASATGTIMSGDTVDYEIVINNYGGVAYHAVLFDDLYNASGTAVMSQDWPLDLIYPDEEITITYTIQYEGDLMPGEYTNVAQVGAVGRHPSFNPFYGTYSNSNTASTTVTLIISDSEPVQSDGGIGELPEEPADEPEEEFFGAGGTLEDLTIPPENSGLFLEPIVIELPVVEFREIAMQYETGMTYGPRKSDWLASLEEEDEEDDGLLAATMVIQQLPPEQTGGLGASVWSAFGNMDLRMTTIYVLLLILLIIMSILAKRYWDEHHHHFHHSHGKHLHHHA